MLNLVLVHLVVSAPVSAIDHGEPVHGGAPSPAPANRSSEGIAPLCRCNCLLRHEIDTCRANHPLCPSGPVVNSLHEFLPPYLLSFRAHRTIRVRRTPCTLTWQGLPSGTCRLCPSLPPPPSPRSGHMTGRPCLLRHGVVRCREDRVFAEVEFTLDSLDDPVSGTDFMGSLQSVDKHPNPLFFAGAT